MRVWWVVVTLVAVSAETLADTLAPFGKDKDK